MVTPVKERASFRQMLNSRYIIRIIPPILSTLIWFADLNNVQIDSQTEIISFSRFLPTFLLRHAPVVWKCAAILCSLGLIFQLANTFTAKRRSPLDYTCIFSWIGISILHIVDYKSEFAQKIGLFKDDLFTLQIFFSTCLSLTSFGYFALSFRRQKYCSHNNKNRKSRNARSLDTVSNCYSFTSSVCSSCNRSTSAKSVRRRTAAMANTSIDDQSPSRILGSKLSSLSLGGTQNLSPKKRSDADSIFGRKSSNSMTPNPKIDFWSTNSSYQQPSFDKLSNNDVFYRPSKFPPSFSYSKPPESIFSSNVDTSIYSADKNCAFSSNFSDYGSIFSTKNRLTADYSYKTAGFNRPNDNDDTISLLSGRSSLKMKRLSPLLAVQKEANATLLQKIGTFVVLPASLVINVAVLYYFYWIYT